MAPGRNPTKNPGKIKARRSRRDCGILWDGMVLGSNPCSSRAAWSRNAAGAGRAGSPASRKVMRQVSLGRKSFRREPLNTYSTTASERPARCRKGRNCFAFCVSCSKTGIQGPLASPRLPPGPPSRLGGGIWAWS